MSSRTTTVYSEALPPSESKLRCQVVVIDGPDAGRAATLVTTDGAEIVIGTDPDCDLVLTDERVSGRHLAVAAASGRFRVRDLDSKNGSLYEGSRITAAVVPICATIKLGRSFVRVQPQPRQPCRATGVALRRRVARHDRSFPRRLTPHRNGTRPPRPRPPRRPPAAAGAGR